MADEIKAPGCPTGLTLSALLFSAGALAYTVPLAESPAGSTNYYASTATLVGLSVASGSYGVLVEDASNNIYATGELNWNATNSSAGANVTRVDGVDAFLGGGIGSYQMVVNVTDASTTLAIAGATVRAAGAAGSAVGITNSSGNVTLALNAGSCIITATAPNYIGYTSATQTVQSTNGGQWASTSTATLAIQMTENPVPSGPGNGTGPYNCNQSGGTGSGGAPITFNGSAITTDQLQIVGLNGLPVLGATISLYYSSDVAMANLLAVQTTSADGRWQAGVNLSSGTYSLVFSVGGYQQAPLTIVCP